MSVEKTLKKYRGSIETLFAPTFNYTFLVGAGISMDSPSNMPSAIHIVKNLLEMCAPPDEVDKLLSIEKLRFELVVEKVQDEFDPELQFLDYLETVIHPNLIHMFLANTIVRGNYVVITNFDYLIECALMKLLEEQWHKEIIPVITKKNFQNYSSPKSLFRSGKYPIYKIHGSKYNIILGVDTKDSLITTISSLGRDREEGETFAIEPYKKPAVYNLMRDRTLVVMGYSGSDDFDIGPTLKELPYLKRLIWIDHSQNEKVEIYTITKDYKSKEFGPLSHLEELLNDISSRGNFEVFLIKANTGFFVQSVLWRIFLPQISIDEYKFNKSETQSPRFKEWIKPLYDNIPLVKKYKFSIQLFYLLKQIEATIHNSKNGILLAEKSNDFKSKSYFLNMLGMTNQIKGNYEEVIKNYEEALNIDEQVKDIHGKATDLNNIGSIYLTLGQYDQALDMYNQSLKIADEIGVTSGKITNLNNIGRIHEIRNELDLAIAKYKESLKFVEEIGDLNRKAALLNNIGMIYSTREQYDLALEHYEEALRISDQLGDLYGSIVLLNNIGRVYHEYSNYAEALKYYEKTLELAEQLGDLAKKAGCLNNLGSIHLAQGNLEFALQHYENALDIEKRLGDPFMTMIYLNNIGMIYAARAEHPLALKNYQGALKFAKRIGDLSKEALLLSKIATIEMNQNNYQLALIKYKEALVIYGDLGDLKNKAACLSNIGKIYEKFEDYNNALKIYKETLEIDNNLEDLAGIASDLYNLGKIYDICGEFSDALENLNKSVNIFNQLNQIQNANLIQEKINEIIKKLGA